MNHILSHYQKNITNPKVINNIEQALKQTIDMWGQGKRFKEIFDTVTNQYDYDNGRYFVGHAIQDLVARLDGHKQGSFFERDGQAQKREDVLDKFGRSPNSAKENTSNN